MTNDTEERLSALIDSELSPAFTTDTLSRLKQSPSLRETWDRYHLIGDAIRGEGVRLSAEGIAEGVRERMLTEPTIIGKPIFIHKSGKFRNRLLRPLAGAAIAASVAALAVFTLPRLTGELPVAGPIQIVSKPPEPVSFANQSGTRWKNLAEPALESKLNRYLENHSEYASSGGMGVVPYYIICQLRHHSQPAMRARYSSLCLLLLCSTLQSAAVSSAERDVRAWLQNMVESVRTLNYRGTFVFLHDNQLESMRIVHTVDAGGEKERLFSLNGAAQRGCQGRRIGYLYRS